MRFLILDAYSPAGREALVGAGGTPAGILYERMLRRLAPESTIDVMHPADASASLPEGVAIEHYDGALWTGSDLTVYDDQDSRVRRQIELAREIYRARVPSFGSCYGIQLAVVAAGGQCEPNPRGREFGVAREVRLSPEGRRHPMYAGKASIFTGFTCHADIVTSLPPGAILLAGNQFSPVQSVDVEFQGGTFWAVQYHPEYDLSEVAALGRLRAEELVAQGSFPDLGACHTYLRDLEELHADPERDALALELGIGSDVLDVNQRTAEVRNWIETRVQAV